MCIRDSSRAFDGLAGDVELVRQRALSAAAPCPQDLQPVPHRLRASAPAPAQPEHAGAVSDPAGGRQRQTGAADTVAYVLEGDQCDGRVSDGGTFVSASPFAASSWDWVRKMLSVRSAPLRSALRKSAPMRSASRKSAPLRSAAMR